MATFPRIKSTRSGFFGVEITHVLILVLPFFARIVIGYPECYNSGTVNRRPKISFKALPYPFVLNLMNGRLWCQGRSITEKDTLPFPFIVQMIFLRNGKVIRSIYEDPRWGVVRLSSSFTVTNIVPSDKFECIVYAHSAPCNVAYLQYKVLDARAPSFIHQYPQESNSSNWLQFSCDALGFPEPEIHWILNDTAITNMNSSEITIYRTAFKVLNETFHVKSTIRFYNPKHPIHVQCFAKNSINHALSRIVYAGYIQDARAPSFIQDYPQESHYSNWLQFSCDALGFPEPEIHWILNDTVITNMNNSEITIYRTAFKVLNEPFHVKSTIRIYNPKHPIRVQCSAKNSINHVFSRIVYARYIQDARGPSFIQDYPQESYYSNWLQFSCDALGFPEPEIHWILNDTVITNMNNSEITIYRTAFKVLNEPFHVKSTIRINNPKHPIRVQCSAKNSIKHAFSRIVYAGYIQVKVSNITSSTVKVWWKITFYSNVSFDNIDGYRVSLTNQQNQSYETNIGRNSKSVTISKNVSVNTTYTCKVIGLLDNGDRLVSSLVHFKTLALSSANARKVSLSLVIVLTFGSFLSPW